MGRPKLNVQYVDSLVVGNKRDFPWSYINQEGSCLTGQKPVFLIFQQIKNGIIVGTSSTCIYLRSMEGVVVVVVVVGSSRSPPHPCCPRFGQCETPFSSWAGCGICLSAESRFWQFNSGRFWMDQNSFYGGQRCDNSSSNSLSNDSPSENYYRINSVTMSRLSSRVASCCFKIKKANIPNPWK